MKKTFKLRVHDNRHYELFQQDGARYDNNGNRIKRPTSNQVPRKNIQHLLIPKQGPRQQLRPLRKIQKQGYPQNLPKPLVSCF